MLDPELLKILACPACENRPPVKEDASKQQLVCTECGRAYPIQGGIPIMKIDDHG